MLGLSEAHVLALRLYTTWVFVSINTPLRAKNRQDAHPLAATVAFLEEAIKQLRSVGSYLPDAQAEKTLWRGMRNLQVGQAFMKLGGSERAPMSTTSDPTVAASYSASESALLFKVKTVSFMDRGVSVPTVAHSCAQACGAWPLAHGRSHPLSAG